MILTDTITLDGVRRTADGYLIASANIARTGIQIYGGREVGRPDLARVRVFRPETEVFKKDTLESFTSLPITIDHPPESVGARNWRKFAHGFTGESVARDGGFVHVPLALKDQAAIDAFEGGKRELSCGYTTDLKWEAGTTPEGEAYDAIQTNIRGNHLAIVSAGRAGSECRLGDDALEGETQMADTAVKTKTVMVDGLSVETTDAGAQAIEKLQGEVKSARDALAKAEAQIATDKAAHVDALAKKDAEIATEKAKQLTGDALDKAIQERTKLIGDAKRLAGDDLKTDGLSDADIRKAAVTKKLGDAACTGKEAAFFDHGFDYALSQLPATDNRVADPLRQVLGDAPVNVGDAKSKAEEARKKREEEMRTAYKGQAA